MRAETVRQRTRAARLVLAPGLVPSPRRMLTACPILAACLILAACGEPVDRGPRPDLLLITVDTLRADRLSCYGGTTGAGIVLCDDLFRGGTRFVWAFSTAPSTAPSIASILTSRYPRDHGVTQFAQTRLASDVESVATVLSRAGYATGAVVSNPVIRSPRQLDQGFDHYDDRMTRRETKRPALRERAAEDTTAAAIAWVRGAQQPWFLWVHYQDPHGPYEPPGAVPVRDGSGEVRLPLLQDQSGFRGIPAYQEIGGIVTPSAYGRRYDQEIRYLEQQISALVGQLERMGRRPAIVLTADHGEAFGEDEFYFAHGHSVGLDQIRVPLFWRPATAHGGQLGPSRVYEGSPVSTLDIAPTLLAAAGVQAPAGFAGRPLPVDAETESPSEARVLFAEHRLRIAAIREREYYARDRRPLTEPMPDAVSGGVLPPLPPRAAHLPEDGTWWGYRPVDPTESAGESAVEDFLSVPARESDLRSGDVDPLAQEALRALGYLE